MKNKLFRAIVMCILVLVSALAVVACKDDQSSFLLKFSVDGVVYASVETNGNEVITLPESPTKDGYEFDGWYFDDETFEDEFSASSLLGVSLTADITVYAKWKESASQNAMDAFLYRETEAGYEITGVVDENATSLTVPSSVIKISMGAFKNCKNIESITVPFVGESRDADAEFTKIQFIFGGVPYVPLSLKKITVTEKADIPKQAFYGAKRVEKIVYENGSKNIGNYAFDGCNYLKEFVIDDDCEIIGASAFGDCSSISELKIPSGVKQIGERAFNGMKIKEITLPASLETLGDAIFRKTKVVAIKVDEDNENFKSVGGVLYSKDGTKLIAYPTGKTDLSFTVPDSVIAISDYAFYQDENLCSITVPDSVTKVGERALDCNALVYFEATRASNFESYWKGFSNNYVWDYRNNDVAEDDCVYFIQDGIRFRLSDHYLEEDEAYVSSYQSRALTSVSIPETITYKGNVYHVREIDNLAFYTCDSVSDVVIPSSVKKIGDYAFGRCLTLKTVTIGEGCRVVSQLAFKNCEALESVAFIDTEGWTVDDIIIDVSDFSLNATRLTSGYYTNYLIKDKQ